MTQEEAISTIEKVHSRQSIDMNNQIKWALDDSSIPTDEYDAVKGMIFKFIHLSQRHAEERYTILKAIGQPTPS